MIKREKKSFYLLLKIVLLKIVILLKKAASCSSDSDEGGLEDGKSYLCPQHSYNVCLILVLLLGDLFGQKLDEDSTLWAHSMNSNESNKTICFK